MVRRFLRLMHAIPVGLADCPKPWTKKDLAKSCLRSKKDILHDLETHVRPVFDTYDKKLGKAGSQIAFTGHDPDGNLIQVLSMHTRSNAHG